MVARVRKFAPGSDRERREYAIPARCLRRGHVLDLQRARGWSGLRRNGMAFADPAHEFSGSELAATRRRHLGSARPAAAIYAIENDGMGGVRSRRKNDRGLRLCG